MTAAKPTKIYNWKYPADMGNVNQVCQYISQVLIENVPTNKKDIFAIDLLAREALNNAVIHGCHQNPLLTFSCHLTISDREVIVEVSDEGNGFNWHGEPEVALSDNSTISGRGRYIYAIYANLIQFNDKGNCVTLTRIINQPHVTQGEEDD